MEPPQRLKNMDFACHGTFPRQAPRCLPPAIIFRSSASPRQPAPHTSPELSLFLGKRPHTSIHSKRRQTQECSLLQCGHFGLHLIEDFGGLYGEGVATQFALKNRQTPRQAGSFVSKISKFLAQRARASKQFNLERQILKNIKLSIRNEIFNHECFFYLRFSLAAEKQGLGLKLSIKNEHFKQRMKISSENGFFVRGGMAFSHVRARMRFLFDLWAVPFCF